MLTLTWIDRSAISPTGFSWRGREAWNHHKWCGLM
jgi:hypothetical protein